MALFFLLFCYSRLRQCTDGRYRENVLYVRVEVLLSSIVSENTYIIENAFHIENIRSETW